MMYYFHVSVLLNAETNSQNALLLITRQSCLGCHGDFKQPRRSNRRPGPGQGLSSMSAYTPPVSSHKQKLTLLLPHIPRRVSRALVDILLRDLIPRHAIGVPSHLLRHDFVGRRLGVEGLLLLLYGHLDILLLLLDNGDLDVLLLLLLVDRLDIGHLAALDGLLDGDGLLDSDELLLLLILFVLFLLGVFGLLALEKLEEEFEEGHFWCWKGLFFFAGVWGEEGEMRWSTRWLVL